MQRNIGKDENAPTCRGRPQKKGKLKVTHQIFATGKGRGRPKNPPKSPERRSPMKINVVKARKIVKKLGRPKKASNSDSSDTDKQDDEERRPVGRPNTGAINLNIARTGRGQGRPKRKRLAIPNESEEKGVKKLGRPSSHRGPYVPTGKPRGRPKISTNLQDEEMKDKLDDDSIAAKENEVC